MKTLLITCVAVLFTAASHTVHTKVFICKGPKSKRYHYKKDCRGLSRCSTKIYEVSKTEAKDLGRTLCGWED